MTATCVGGASPSFDPFPAADFVAVLSVAGGGPWDADFLSADGFCATNVFPTAPFNCPFNSLFGSPTGVPAGPWGALPASLGADVSATVVAVADFEAVPGFAVFSLAFAGPF
jgi:hypothetical protein